MGSRDCAPGSTKASTETGALSAEVEAQGRNRHCNGQRTLGSFVKPHSNMTLTAQVYSEFSHTGFS